MTTDELREYDWLGLMTTDTHKFAVSVEYQTSLHEQQALERLMLRDWIRLIDVSPLAEIPGRLFRVFRVMPEAIEWYRKVS